MKIELEDPVFIPAGVKIKLTADQASARAHILGKAKAGTYQAEQALQFKRGETIEIVGKLPKGILPAYDRAMAAAEKAAAEKEAAEKAAAEKAAAEGPGDVGGEGPEVDDAQG